MKNFDECVILIRKDEGDAYTNDPSDAGGPTKFGITLKDVQLHIKKNATADDVRNLTWAEARNVYKTKYWDALDADNLPAGVDYTCVDYGINSGLGRPRKALQKFKSLSGSKLIDAINDERMTFLRAIGVGHNAKFLNGWTNRVSRVRSFSHKLATRKDNTTGPAVVTAGSGLAYYLSTMWHNHEYLIIGSGVAVAVLAGIAIHYYRNKK